MTQSSTQVKRPPHGVLLTILAGLAMIGPFSIDTMFPAMQRMGAGLNASPQTMQHTVSVYLLAFAAMCMFHGPVSDAVGRKPVLVVGGLCYVVAAIGCALAPNVWVLLACRAVQGASSGAGQIVSRAMVRDLFSDAEAQRTMAHIAMIFAVAPAVAPLVGGWLLAYGPWPWIFWFLAALGLVVLLAVVLVLPESHPVERRTPLHADALVRSLGAVWAVPAGRRLAINGMLNFSGMWLYISSAALFIVHLVGGGEQDFGWLFIPLISGMVVGSWTSGRLAGRISGERLASIGYVVSIVGGVLNLALTLIPGTAHLPWVVAALPLYSFGVATAYPIITLAMLDEFPTHRGAASSVQSLVSLTVNAFTAGVLAPLLATRLWHLAAAALLVTLASAALWERHRALRRRANG